MRESKAMTRNAALIAAALTLVGGAASAHHALNAQFDPTKTAALTATLTKVELINPHSYLQLTDKAGAKWSMETAAPATMKRQGISARDAFKIGETYTVYYSPARNGEKIGVMHALVLLDGRFVGMGSALNIEAARAMNAAAKK